MSSMSHDTGDGRGWKSDKRQQRRDSGGKKRGRKGPSLSGGRGRGGGPMTGERRYKGDSKKSGRGRGRGRGGRLDSGRGGHSRGPRGSGGMMSDRVSDSRGSHSARGRGRDSHPRDDRPQLLHSHSHRLGEDIGASHLSGGGYRPMTLSSGDHMPAPSHSRVGGHSDAGARFGGGVPAEHVRGPHGGHPHAGHPHAGHSHAHAHADAEHLAASGDWRPGPGAAAAAHAVAGGLPESGAAVGGMGMAMGMAMGMPPATGPGADSQPPATGGMAPGLAVPGASGVPPPVASDSGGVAPAPTVAAPMAVSGLVPAVGGSGPMAGMSEAALRELMLAQQTAAATSPRPDAYRYYLQQEHGLQQRIQQLLATGDAAAAATVSQLMTHIQQFTNARTVLSQQIVSNPISLEEKLIVNILAVTRSSGELQSVQTEFQQFQQFATQAQMSQLPLPPHIQERALLLQQSFPQIAHRINELNQDRGHLLATAGTAAQALLAQATVIGNAMVQQQQHVAAAHAQAHAAAAAAQPTAAAVMATATATTMATPTAAIMPMPGAALSSGVPAAMPTLGGGGASGEFKDLDVQPFVPDAGDDGADASGDTLDDASGFVLNPTAEEFMCAPQQLTDFQLLPPITEALGDAEAGDSGMDWELGQEIPKPDELLKEFSNFQDADSAAAAMTDTLFSTAEVFAPMATATTYLSDSILTAGSLRPTAAMPVASGSSIEASSTLLPAAGGILGAAVSASASAESSSLYTVGAVGGDDFVEDYERQFEGDAEFVHRIEDRELDSGLAKKFAAEGSELQYDMHYFMQKQRLFFDSERLCTTVPVEWHKMDERTLRSVASDQYSYIASLPVVATATVAFDEGVAEGRDVLAPATGSGPLRPVGDPSKDPTAAQGYTFGQIEESRTPIEKLQRKLVTILNKVTVENFDLLKQQMVEVIHEMVDNKDKLQLVVNAILNKASEDPTFSRHYADLCKYLSHELQEFALKFSESREKRSTERVFRSLIITQLEAEQRERRRLALVQLSTEAQFADWSKDELVNESLKRKKRFLGVVAMMAQLNLKQILKDKILHCVLEEWVSRGEWLDIEAFCTLIETEGERQCCGERLQVKELLSRSKKHSRRTRLEQYVEDMCRHSSRIDTRTRFMMENIRDRMKQWSRAGFRERFLRATPEPKAKKTKATAAATPTTTTPTPKPKKVSTADALDAALRAYMKSPTAEESLKALRQLAAGSELTAAHWAQALKDLLVDTRLAQARLCVQLFGLCSTERWLDADQFSAVCRHWAQSWKEDVKDFPDLPEYYGKIVMCFCVGQSEALLSSTVSIFLDSAFAETETSNAKAMLRLQKYRLVKFAGGLALEMALFKDEEELTKARRWLKALRLLDRVSKEQFEAQSKYSEYLSFL